MWYYIGASFIVAPVYVKDKAFTESSKYDSKHLTDRNEMKC